MILHLVIDVCGMWHPEIALPLLPIDVDKYDIVISHQKDMKDEMESLRRDLESLKENFASVTNLLKSGIQAIKRIQPSKAYISLCFATNVTGSTFIPWDGDCKPVQSSNPFYSISNDYTAITVKRKGLYQVIVRLLLAKEKDEQESKIKWTYTYGHKPKNYASLFVNDNAVASAHTGENEGAHYSTQSIIEIFTLQRNATVSVQTGSQGCISEGPGYGANPNRLILLLLDDLEE